MPKKPAHDPGHDHDHDQAVAAHHGPPHRPRPRPRHRRSSELHTTPDAVVARLREGNRRFVEGRSVHPRQTRSRLHAQAHGQTPFVAILGCADSRVPLEEVFDMGVGDIFACRLAGNIATPEVIASIEYAVLALGVRVVLVLGHAECGAIHAALSGEAHPGFIDTLVNGLEVALKAAPPGATQDDVMRLNVAAQMERLARSAILRQAGVRVLGASYDVRTGVVHFA